MVSGAGVLWPAACLPLARSLWHAACGMLPDAPPPPTHPPTPPGPQMIELLGRMPRRVATSGRDARKYFDREGRLRHISRLNYWPLERVLQEKYRMPEREVSGVLHCRERYCHLGGTAAWEVLPREVLSVGVSARCTHGGGGVGSTGEGRAPAVRNHQFTC
jgi:hypothetical protein